MDTNTDDTLVEPECSIESCDRLDQLYNDFNDLYDQLSIAYLSGREDGKNESREVVKRLRDALIQTWGDAPHSWVKQLLKETEHFQ